VSRIWGTCQGEDHFHVFDSLPSLEIIPKQNNAGFRIKFAARDTSSHSLLSEISLFKESISVYEDFVKRYETLIQQH